MSGYSDTTLIECSQRTSEEARSGQNKTPAVFTNKQGTGLRLNEGDVVSMDSAFISERGCGGEVIEFTGEDIPGATYKLRQTRLVRRQPSAFGKFGIDRDVEMNETMINAIPPKPYGDIHPYKAGEVYMVPEEKEYQMKDNVAHFTQTFYKTTNGDGYFFLPRRFDALHAPPDKDFVERTDTSENDFSQNRFTEGGTFQPSGNGRNGMMFQGESYTAWAGSREEMNYFWSFGLGGTHGDDSRTGPDAGTPPVQQPPLVGYSYPTQMGAYANSSFTKVTQPASPSEIAKYDAPKIGRELGYDCPKNGRPWTSVLPRNQVPTDWYEYQGQSGKDSTNPFWKNGVEADDPNNIDPNDPFLEGYYYEKGYNTEMFGTSNQGIQEIAEECNTEELDGIFKQRNDNSRFTIYAKDVNYYTNYQTNEANGNTNRQTSGQHIQDPDNQPANNVAMMDAGFAKKIYENPDSLTPQNIYDSARTEGTVSTYNPSASRMDFWSRDGNTEGHTITSDREPSLSGYTKYQEIKTLEVDAGFNAPSNVAQTVTNQLNKTEGLTDKYGWAGLWIDPVGDPNSYAAYQMNQHQRQVVISTRNNCETYKSFASANWDSFSEQNWKDYMGYRSAAGVLEDARIPLAKTGGADGVYPGPIQHLSSYQYIGVKRPDLFDAYRNYQISKAQSEGNYGTILETTQTIGDTIVGANTIVITQKAGGYNPSEANGGFHGAVLIMPDGSRNTIVSSTNQPPVGPVLGTTTLVVQNNVKNLIPGLTDLTIELSMNFSWRNLNHSSVLVDIPVNSGNDIIKPNVSDVVINQEWTPDNLKRLKDVFDVEGKHPELFEGYAHTNVDKNNVRAPITIYVCVGSVPANQTWSCSVVNGGAPISYSAGDDGRIYHYHCYANFNDSDAPAGSVPIESMDFQFVGNGSSADWKPPSHNPEAFTHGFIACCLGHQMPWRSDISNNPPEAFLFAGGPKLATSYEDLASGGYIDGANLHTQASPITFTGALTLGGSPGSNIFTIGPYVAAGGALTKDGKTPNYTKITAPGAFNIPPPATENPITTLIYYGTGGDDYVYMDTYYGSDTPYPSPAPTATMSTEATNQDVVKLILYTNNPSKFQTKGASSEYMRFIHMNTWNGWRSPNQKQLDESAIPADTTNEYVELGSDNCLEPKAVVGTTFFGWRNQDFSSCPLFVYFDKTRSDVASGGLSDSDLYYGFAKKYRHSDGKDYISLTTKNIGGIPLPFFVNFTQTVTGAPPVASTPGIILVDIRNRDPGADIYNRNRSIGFDCHFTAYGTSAIALYSGILNANADKSEEYKVNSVGEHYTRTTFSERGKGTTNTPMWPSDISKWMRERYVGANSPLLAFDADGERFNFQDLHTPLYTGNLWNAGQTATAVLDENGKPVAGSAQPVPLNPAAGDKAILINRRLNLVEFCPEMMPYLPPQEMTLQGLDKQDMTSLNPNLFPWTPYDSDGGIFLEDFGISEEDWELSFWGVLGFSYEQFHPNRTTLTRQTRINNIVEANEIARPTTNGNITASDLVAIRTNSNGASLYVNQLPPATMCLNIQNSLAEKMAQETGSGPNNGPAAEAIIPPEWGKQKCFNQVNYPPVNIKQTSAQISAQNLPRKMLNSFYLVKSNIIGDVGYLGGPDSGQALPIVGVVNKENGFGDFYFSQGSVNFTITHPRVITEITTSIHQPNMELAKVNKGSSIIYKVIKQNNASLSVVADILAKKKTLPPNTANL